RVRVALRRRPADRECVEEAERGAGDEPRVGCVEPRSEAARLQVRRLDRDLRAHAGDGPRERPRRRLLPLRAVTQGGRRENRVRYLFYWEKAVADSTSRRGKGIQIGRAHV